nr:sugar phosphate isomerase/epimerase [Deltaproteobacteria bacterium]
MGGWVAGLSTGSFYKVPLIDVLESIAQSGFSLLEISSSPAHLDYHNLAAVKAAAHAMRSIGLTSVSFHAPFGRDIDISSLDERQREHSVREMLVSAQAAAVLGVDYLVVHPGGTAEGRAAAREYHLRMENAVTALTRIARTCADLGIRLLLENMLPHLRLGQTRDILRLLPSLGIHHAGICFDTGHAYLSGDVYSSLPKVSDHLSLVHLNDNRGRGDDHLPPGEGSIDWKKFLCILAKISYWGPLILELSDDSTNRSENILARASDARRLLKLGQ